MKCRADEMTHCADTSTICQFDIMINYVVWRNIGHRNEAVILPLPLQNLKMQTTRIATGLLPNRTYLACKLLCMCCHGYGYVLPCVGYNLVLSDLFISSSPPHQQHCACGVATSITWRHKPSNEAGCLSQQQKQNNRSTDRDREREIV